MSHNLTQPEELDHILKAMSGRNMGANTPIPNGAHSSADIQNAEHDEFASAYGAAAHKKSKAQGWPCS